MIGSNGLPILNRKGRTMTTQTTQTPTDFDAFVANLTQSVDVDAAVRRIVASTDGSQSLVRPDRRFATDAPATVVRRAERVLTVKRAANMIAFRTGTTRTDVLVRFGFDPKGSHRTPAPREMVDALAAVHNTRKG